MTSFESHSALANPLTSNRVSRWLARKLGLDSDRKVGRLWGIGLVVWGLWRIWDLAAHLYAFVNLAGPDYLTSAIIVALAFYFVVSLGYVLAGLLLARASRVAAWLLVGLVSILLLECVAILAVRGTWSGLVSFLKELLILLPALWHVGRQQWASPWSRPPLARPPN